MRKSRAVIKIRCAICGNGMPLLTSFSHSRIVMSGIGVNEYAVASDAWKYGDASFGHSTIEAEQLVFERDSSN